MLKNIENEIYTQLEMLFAEAAAHQLVNDMSNYQECLEKIARVADVLGVKTDIVRVKINLRKQGRGEE